jgi:hypothetical protein
MKGSTVGLLILLIASLGSSAAALTDLDSSIIPQANTTTSYNIPGQLVTGGSGSVYQFKTPVLIQSGSMMYGNLTSYCVQSPASFGAGGHLPPTLYVLTSTDLQLWNGHQSNTPSVTVASILANNFANYTYNGPAQTEGLDFRVHVDTPDVYYFVAYVPFFSCGEVYGQNTPSLNLNVMTIGPDPTISGLVKIVSLISTIVFAVATIWDHRRD